MIAQLVRNRIIKAIKTKLDLPNFELLELEIANGKVRYRVNYESWMVRDLETDELNELQSTTGIDLTECKLEASKSIIKGTYKDGQKESSFNF